MLKPGIFLLLIMASSMSAGKNLGNYGEIFSVIEIDVRKVILEKLQVMEKKGELLKHQEIITHNIAENAIRPKPLLIGTMPKTLVHFIDPSIKVNQDIVTPEGHILARKGTLLNPLSQINYNKTLFFFDGDDRNQVAWAKAHYKEYGFVKFILTGGSIKEAASTFGRIYFDQGGVLTHQLQIQHVPAVVEQAGLLWKISEIGMNDA